MAAERNTETSISQPTSNPLSRAGGLPPAPLFSREDLCRSLIEELFPLLEAHYQEIASFHDIPLAPNLGMYDAVHQDGKLRIYTVRVGGKVAGYGVFVVSPALHYSSSLQATQDIFFLHPDSRGLGLGAKLVAYCEEQLRREGVQLVAHHVKNAHPKLAALLDLQGYSPIEVIWLKRLDIPTFPVPTHQGEAF